MGTTLVTGGAGFIGSHTSKRLLESGESIVCVDDFNDYYDPRIKEDRISKFLGDYTFPVHRISICDFEGLKKIFKKYKIDRVCHLAARAGVRASINDPFSYQEVNIQGTLNLLELSKDNDISNFVFASSSSVYGGNRKVPFSENDPVDSPVSVYAATKKSSELLAHVYHNLYKLNVTGLRFFTVYGPFGRPDMAYYKFTKKILSGEPIDVYNHGKHQRDFTYIDDIIDGVIQSLEKPHDYEIFNLGNSQTVELEYFISVIEKELGIEAKRNLLPLQPGDVVKTYADITKANKMLGFNPKTSVELGIKNFINWYKDYYK
ncbi:GDP-mannose 4,6-dehydratase [Patescibacteria group bacterium]|nr:GDP-mannose 4,6-dehydratase [Patescibacteria group bacterium]MBU1952096.1 GDP-mannose 4,6-dehydratase [Patescibacteria group bacterium]